MVVLTHDVRCTNSQRDLESVYMVVLTHDVRCTNSQRDLESVYGGTNPRCEVYKLTERPRVCIWWYPRCEGTNSQRDLESVYYEWY